MRVAALAVLAGCSSLFGLDKPLLRSDAGDNDVDAIDAAPDPSQCPVSYSVAMGTSRYRTSTGAAAWVDAAASCANDAFGPSYTHLVVLANEAERGFINSFNPEAIWIGLSDRLSEAQYRWNTAEQVNGYPELASGAWGFNEPNGGVNENCVAMNKDGALVDQSCDVQLRFVCECDAYADDPARYTP